MSFLHTTPWAIYNEIDEYAADWLENLIARGVIAPGVVDRRSIEDLCGDDLRGFRQVHLFAGIGVWSYSLRRAGVPDDFAVWTGSCPCQPFSAAGKGAGMVDERHLWPAVIHLVRECRPRVFYGEQVASSDGLAWLDLVQTDLEASGYAIGALDTCSAGSGAPHIRQRLRICAYDLGPAAGGMEYLPGIGWIKRRTEPGEWGAIGGRGIERVADHSLLGCDVGAGFRGSDAGERGRNESSNGFPIDGLDHHHHQGLEGHGCGHSPAFGHRQGPLRSTSEAGEFDWLADTDRDEQREGGDAGSSIREGLRSEPGGRDGSGFVGRIERPGPTNGFWRDADWLFCRDGKWRPVEPESFPLAHGAPSRVGRLRAYGNAVDAEATCIFIEACLDAAQAIADGTIGKNRRAAAQPVTIDDLLG